MSALRNVHQAASQALEVFKKCRDCTGEYKNFAREARNLANILQDVEDAIVSRQLSRPQQDELTVRLNECNDFTSDLDARVEQYSGMSVAARMTWDRLHWGQGGGEDITTRLQRNIKLVTDFYDALKDDPQSQIERALDQLAEEISKGRHETASVASLSTLAAYDDGQHEPGWDQIVRDLGNYRIQESVVAEYRIFIVDWILKAISSGLLSENIHTTTRVDGSDKYLVEQVRTPPPLSPPPLPPKIPSPTSDAMALATPPADYHAQSNSYNSNPSLRQEVSREVPRWDRPPSLDEPPSPLEQEIPDTNILGTAQQIVHHWNRHEWNLARKYLEEQIQAVERGEFVEISGVPTQPDIRILRHLLGVCYSYSGDFIQAKEFFESVLQGVYVEGLPMDDGDIAAAQWLGETCIILSQTINAGLAFAIAVHGLMAKSSLHTASNHAGPRALDEIRFLNDKTSVLRTIKNSFQNSNRDNTTILSRMPGTAKFQVVLTALEQLQHHQQSQNYVLGRLAQSIALAEGFLIQPLVSQTSWPFPQDPFFQNASAINLLSILSRPKQNFIEAAVTSVGLGASKGLTYVTKQPLKWLVEAVRYALNTYSIEFKVQGSTYLLRLSQTHDNIGYYECFAIKVRKLSLRSVYGIKVTESLYSTRSFQSARQSVNNASQTSIDMSQSEAQRKEIVRKELADRLKDYLEQVEKDVVAGKPWPPTEMPTLKAPFEMSAASAVRPAELAGREGLAPVELDARAQNRPKYHYELPNMEIAELPG